MSWKAKIKELGLNLPEVVPPLAAYTPAVVSGNLVYTSGQLPIVKGELTTVGKVSETPEGIVNPEQAYEAAKICAINALAAINSVIDLDRVTRIIKVVGFVNSAQGFSDQPQVMNGASELLNKIFGDQGVHARSAVGVAELPKGASVEVEIIAEFA